MSDVTKVLQAIREGESGAEQRLLPLVYAELNRMAAGAMLGERPERTLSPTALVHEAYLRLIGTEGKLSFENRRHFYGAAGRAMRRILVDAARHRSRAKRGGGERRQVPLADLAAKESDTQLLALHEALTELASQDALAAEVVELHHFAGLAHEKVAELLGTSLYEVRQKWTFARAWLRDAVS